MLIESSNNAPDIIKKLEGISIDDIANYYLSLDIKHGFIQHPQNIPIQAKAISHQTRGNNNQEPCLGLGIRFYSNNKFFLNQRLQICITINAREHCFCGEVVLLENINNQLLIGVWIDDIEETKQLRTLQQYCHLENCIREKHLNIDLSNDEKWSKFLHSVFPSI